MEFPNLGKHCYFCKQLDFLPFQCKCCKEHFCSIHRHKVNHDCPIKSNSLENNKRKPKYKPNTKPVGFKCTFCKRRELVEIRCMWCKELMCIPHRFPTDHKCTQQKKKLFHKQTVENDIKRMTNKEKKIERKKFKENCSIQ